MSRTNPTAWEAFKSRVFIALNGKEAPDCYDDGQHAHHTELLRNYHNQKYAPRPAPRPVDQKPSSRPPVE